MDNVTGRELKVVEGGKGSGHSIGADFMHFNRREYTTWRDLFNGYQHIHLMTYSIGMPFVDELMDLFDDGEVIIGSNSQLPQSAADLMSLQKNVMDYVSDHATLQKKIDSEDFHMFVASDMISHSKVYLLKNDNGKTRVITGSANASERAWDSAQAENYSVCDDPDYYDICMEQFELLKEISTDEIVKDSKRVKDDLSNVDELPVLKAVKESKEGLVLHDVGDREAREFAFTIAKTSKQIQELLTKAEIRPTKKDGGTLFNIERVKELKVIAKKLTETKKEQSFDSPSLAIDYENQRLKINDVQQNLQPVDSDVKNDISLWLEYVNGYEQFTGDVRQMKETAWKILNYTFLSPFIAELRYQGSIVQINGRNFPMYLLLMGPSDNGKTELTSTCQRLVLGSHVQPLNQKTFSDATIKGLDESVKGCPIVIDDVTSTQWRYADDIVKRDDVLIDNKLRNHPTYLISSNSVKTITQAVSKRVIIFRCDNQIASSAAKKVESDIRRIQGGMGNAFFRKYFGQMLPKVGNMVHLMLDDDMRPEGWEADIFKLSAETIFGIMAEEGIDAPEELHAFTWDEYMGDTATSAEAIKKIKELYHLSPDIFKVNRKDNELVIDFSDMEGRAPLLKLLANELPKDVERNVVGNKICMKLDQIQEYTGIIFKQRGHFFGNWRK